MNPFFLFCLVGFAAAADVTVGHVGVYIGATCSVKDAKGASGYKNGNVFVEVGGCIKNDAGTKSLKYNCPNDTAMGFVEYNTTNCKGPVAKTEVVSLSSVCKSIGGGAASMRLDGKCGAVMNCVTNATETPQKKHVCTAKATTTTKAANNNSSKKTSDATAASATVGLVISALALRL